MKEKLTPYLKQKIDSHAISIQYIDSNNDNNIEYNDPLMEDKHEVVKGLIHKYKNRALIKISYQCAAHCRFCTRIRQIGNPIGNLNDNDIINIINYLKKNTEIEDVILSGGDPFLTPQITSKILAELSKIESIKIIRIGTRLPVQSPKSFESKPIKSLLTQINKIVLKKPFFILIHVNHPEELDLLSLNAIKNIRETTSATLLSQTVFINNLNIDEIILTKLFKTLYFNGVIPYYIYHCDKVIGLEKFSGNIKEEKEVMRKLRNNLSGISIPTYVVDIENGYGKYPVDLNLL